MKNTFYTVTVYYHNYFGKDYHMARTHEYVCKGYKGFSSFLKNYLYKWPEYNKEYPTLASYPYKVTVNKTVVWD